MHTTNDRHSAPGVMGRVLHSPAAYDLLAGLLLLGRERAFREGLVTLADLEPGQSVLDVGCGTGSLAIAAKRRVGAAGTVDGLDASPEMIEAARRKAGKAGVEVTFTTGVVEALPYADGRFDVVMSTLMLHHLPSVARELCAREMRRVLKPAGRILAVDFGASSGHGHGLFQHFHRHGNVAVEEIATLLRGAGLTILGSGPVGVRNMNFVLATRP